MSHASHLAELRLMGNVNLISTLPRMQHAALVCLFRFLPEALLAYTQLSADTPRGPYSVRKYTDTVTCTHDGNANSPNNSTNKTMYGHTNKCLFLWYCTTLSLNELCTSLLKKKLSLMFSLLTNSHWKGYRWVTQYKLLAERSFT